MSEAIRTSLEVVYEGPSLAQQTMGSASQTNQKTVLSDNASGNTRSSESDKVTYADAASQGLQGSSPPETISRPVKRRREPSSQDQSDETDIDTTLDVNSLTENLGARLSEILPEIIPGQCLSDTVVKVLKKVVTDTVDQYIKFVLPDKIKTAFDELISSSNAVLILSGNTNFIY